MSTKTSMSSVARSATHLGYRGGRPARWPAVGFGHRSTDRQVDKVFIVGGPAAVSTAMQALLKAVAKGVRRTAQRYASPSVVTTMLKWRAERNRTSLQGCYGRYSANGSYASWLDVDQRGCRLDVTSAPSHEFESGFLVRWRHPRKRTISGRPGTPRTWSAMLDSRRRWRAVSHAGPTSTAALKLRARMAIKMA